MSCVPHVMYGLLCVGCFAVALLRICMVTSKIKICYQSCDQKNTPNRSDSVALSRGSALPLPLRAKMSGHAALSGAVLARSSDCALLAVEVKAPCFSGAFSAWEV